MRRRHPKKEVEAALQVAESAGWTVRAEPAKITGFHAASSATVGARRRIGVALCASEGDGPSRTGIARQLTPAAAEALLAYPWPGNVRELRNAMERAAIFCAGAAVGVEDLPSEIREPSAGGGPRRRDAGRSEAVEWPQGTDFQSAKGEVLESFERGFWTGVLRRHRGNVSRAAREAGIHRQNLQKKLRQLGIEARQFRN